MWRSVFLHEFPDRDVRNFHGLPGRPAPGSFQFNPSAVAPGERFTYDLTDPLDDVIGVSARLRIRKPVTGQSDLWLLFRAGSDVEFRIQELPGTLPGPAAKARCLLRIGGGPAVEIGNVIFPHRDFVDLRVDWHTSGQARLVRNGHLVGYHNAVAPGSAIAITDITVGRADIPLGTPGARFGIEKVFVRALRRSDSLAVLSRLLPTTAVAPDPRLARCRTLAVTDLLAVAQLLRPFMTAFHAKESVPWSADTGTPTAFTPAAVTAHDEATKAGAALIVMLRNSDFSKPQLFLDPFRRFLEALRDALPDQFESFAKAAVGGQPDRRECHELLRHDLEDSGADYFPIVRLIESASRIVSDIAGV